MTQRILCVDDEQAILDFFARLARQESLELEGALGPMEGLRRVRENKPYAVIVSDLRMPEMNGIEFLEKTREMDPEAIRMILTGAADMQAALEAINRDQVFRFITKPCDPDHLLANLNAAREQYRLVHAEKILLEKTLAGSIKILIDLLAMMDEEIFGQAVALRKMVRSLRQSWDIKDGWRLEIAAMLLKMGYVTLPPETRLKLKQGVHLDTMESELVRRTPQIGYDFVANIPRLEAVAEIILYQCKWHNGGGFPYDSISRDAIPSGAQILQILNDYLQRQTAGQSPSSAFSTMKAQKGRYDPQILEAIRCIFAKPDIASPVPPPPGAPGHRISQVSLANLRIGDVAAQDIRVQDGRLLISAGIEITSPLLAKIRNYAACFKIIEPIRIFTIEPSPEVFSNFV
ncbi:MAG: response regulator [Candidatus Sumerlaeota bacterium]|nr:response regulator [Candidatus Sumerlaeota bacterium]